MEQFSKTRYIPTVVFLVVLFFIFGVYVGVHNRPEIDKVIGLSNKETQIATNADFASFWKVWNTINEKYPRADEITNQNRVYGAITGLVGSLGDPYSVFFS